MRIRHYKPSDSTKLSEFMKHYFLEDQAFSARSHEPDYYVWKYGMNYCGKSIVWIAEDNSQIVGIFGVVPRFMWIDGNEYLSGERVDAFIRPDYHGKGLFKQLVARVFADCDKAGIVFLFGSPNKNTCPIWVKKYDFRIIFEYRSLVRPLHFNSIVFHRIPNKIVSVLIGTPLSVIYGLLFRGGFRNGSITLEKITRPDGRLDEVWEENRNRYVFSLVKTRDYLNYRYMANPEGYDFYLVKKSRRLIGYVVIKLNEIKGLTFAHIVDLAIPPDSHKDFDHTIYCIVQLMQRRKVDFISSWAIPKSPVFRMYRKYGFVPRRKKFWFVMKSCKDGIPLPNSIDDVNLWVFSQGDTDNI